MLSASGQPVPGLYAAGEAAGFGGGGMHGYRSLEGTFLGGCLFSGRIAGRAAAAAVALSAGIPQDEIQQQSFPNGPWFHRGTAIRRRPGDHEGFIHLFDYYPSPGKNTS